MKNDSKKSRSRAALVKEMQSKDMRYHAFLLRSAARRKAAEDEMIALRKMLEEYPLQWIYPSPLWCPTWKPEQE